MIKNISVIGSGVMGHGIAQTYALSEFEVSLYDLNEDILAKAITEIDANLALLVEENVITEEDKVTASNRIACTTDLHASVKNADFITEVIPEILSLKHELYAKLENMVGPETIIASNTSTFPISQLTENMKSPNRFVITHFFNPAQLVPLVEIIKREDTSIQTIESTMNLMKMIGKTPVLLKKDIPGFIVNRLQAAVVREALHLVEEGVADAADIDLAVTEGPGFRWAFTGPIKTADYGGLDTWKRVIENLAPELSKSEVAPRIIDDRISEGKLGTKSGEGIYTYAEQSTEKEIKARDRKLIRLNKMKVESNNN